MVEARPSCLILCSGHKEGLCTSHQTICRVCVPTQHGNFTMVTGNGVCAQSFIHAFTLTNSAFTLAIATPQGIPIDFVNVDETSRRWISEFRTKSYASPLKLESVDPSRFSALLLPNSPGALYDLSKHDTVMHILRSFTISKKPICAIGFGAVALAAGRHGNKEWCFKGYSLTGPSVYEMLQRKDFGSLPIIFEDFAKDNLASYTASDPHCLHVVIDRNLITGQNTQSTLTAVQNLILASNAR